MSKPQRILVTGATGYIGGRLVPELLKAGYTVRVMTRDTKHLQGRTWMDRVEIRQGNMLNPESLSEILDGVDAAYYLIHSMDGPHDFHERDVKAAHNFGQAAREAGVQQIIYLGGLGDRDKDSLSQHLSSRQLVGEILREYSDSVTEFRAAAVIGSGSTSFEMIRYLTERIPVMIAPRWLYTRTQPIGIRHVLQYLVAALETPASRGEIIEIGVTDVLTYKDMILGYARARGLKRYIIPVPFLTPRLSSYWVHLMTPISADIIRPLIEGLRNEMIVRDGKARHIFPDIEPFNYEEAVEKTLEALTAHRVETTWADSAAAVWASEEPYTFIEEQGMMIERRTRIVDAEPHHIYQAFTSLGGETGWLYLNPLWVWRGRLDRWMGGVGYRRGRRDPADLRVGDAVDFWRVEALEPDQMMCLRAEMKLPGRGWLQFHIEQTRDGKNRLIQTAYFASKGLFGFLYWYALFIPHKFIFSGMIDRIVARAEQISRQATTTPDTNTPGDVATDTAADYR